MLDTKFNSVYDVISIFTQFLNLNIFGKRRFYCFMEFYVIHLKKSIKLIIKEWDVSRQDIDLFIEQAITCHPTIKFTAEISEKEIKSLDTVVSKVERFQNEVIFDVKTQYKPNETFRYTHCSSCLPPGVKRGCIKGEENILLRTESSESNFQEAMCHFKHD